MPDWVGSLDAALRHEIATRLSKKDVDAFTQHEPTACPRDLFKYHLNVLTQGFAPGK